MKTKQLTKTFMRSTAATATLSFLSSSSLSSSMTPSLHKQEGEREMFQVVLWVFTNKHILTSFKQKIDIYIFFTWKLRLPAVLRGWLTDYEVPEHLPVAVYSVLGSGLWSLLTAWPSPAHARLPAPRPNAALPSLAHAMRHPNFVNILWHFITPIPSFITQVNSDKTSK